MPAIYDALVQRQGLTPGKAWRVSFIVPFILITSTAIAMLLLCPDTPTGKWSERHLAVDHSAAAQESPSPKMAPSLMGEKTSEGATGYDAKMNFESKSHGSSDQEAQATDNNMVDIARGEIIQKPNAKALLTVIFSLQTLTLTAGYFCSFGGELAINSILGSYYLKNFPTLGQTGSGRWAAMFGFLNVITRPAGGFIGDLLYKYTNSLWIKKAWIHFTGVVTGAMLIAIGLSDPKNLATMMGLIGGMAFFHEAGNGANFALVPHVHPFANGNMPRLHTGLPRREYFANLHLQVLFLASRAGLAILEASSSPSSSGTTEPTTHESFGLLASSISS